MKTKNKLASFLASALLLVACGEADSTASKDDTYCFTGFKVSVDCETLEFNSAGFCFMMKEGENAPKIRKGLLRIGGDVNGDGKLQDSEVTIERSATTGSKSFYSGKISGLPPQGSKKGLMELTIVGDNGQTYVKDRKVLKH